MNFLRKVNAVNSEINPKKAVVEVVAPVFGNVLPVFLSASLISDGIFFPSELWSSSEDSFWFLI